MTKNHNYKKKLVINLGCKIRIITTTKTIEVNFLEEGIVVAAVAHMAVVVKGMTASMTPAVEVMGSKEMHTVAVIIKETMWVLDTIIEVDTAVTFKSVEFLVHHQFELHHHKI
jgi:hypothetical protein